MAAQRNLLCLVLATGSAWAAPPLTPPAAAPGSPFMLGAPRADWLPGNRSYLGLNVRRSAAEGCDTITLVCEERRPTQLYAGTMVGRYWGAEVGVLNPGRNFGAETRGQGVSFSLVGAARLGNSPVGVFGRLGTTYGRPDTAIMGAGPDQGFGLAWGGGVSYAVTPRLSATIELDSRDYRFSSGAREPVRSTSLGLQWRY
jgi:opacity protein-like surface antigen